MKDKNDEYREIKKPYTYPMIELSNGDIVQFLAYADIKYRQEVWRVFNNHSKKYIYFRETDTWATREGNVISDIKKIKEL